MAKRVVGIMSISSAPNWWLSEDFKTFEPVAAWAVVEIFDTEYEALGVAKHIVGLKAEEITSVEDIAVDDRWYYHDSQFEVLGRELK